MRFPCIKSNSRKMRIRERRIKGTIPRSLIFFSTGDGPVSERVARTVVDITFLALARFDPRAQSARRGVHPLPRAGTCRDLGAGGSTVLVAGEPSRSSW